MAEEMELDNVLTGNPNIDPETGEMIERNNDFYRPIDDERVNNVLNALGAAVKPVNARRDRLRNMRYNLVNDARKQTMRSVLTRADVSLKAAGEFIRMCSDQALAQSAGQVDRRTPTPPPEPRAAPVINNLEDRASALRRIRVLMDELDDIITSKPTSSDVAKGSTKYRDSTLDIDTLNSCLLEVINTPM